MANDVFSGSVSKYRPGIVLNYVVIDEDHKKLEVRFGDQIIPNRAGDGYTVLVIDGETFMSFGYQIKWEVQTYGTPIKVTYEFEE